MPDDRTKKGAQDRDRINMGEDYEVRYWTQKWGVTKERLQQAIDKVGASIKAVARELGQPE